MLKKTISFKMRECRRVGHAPPMGRQHIEPTPLVLMWVRSSEHGKTGLLICQVRHGWRRDCRPTSPHLTPSTPEAGGRAGPTLISCRTQESKLYLSPVQHSGVGMRDPTLRMWKWEKWPHPLLLAAGGKLAWAMQERSLWWWGQGRIGGLTNPAIS